MGRARKGEQHGDPEGSLPGCQREKADETDEAPGIPQDPPGKNTDPGDHQRQTYGQGVTSLKQDPGQEGECYSGGRALDHDIAPEAAQQDRGAHCAAEHRAAHLVRAGAEIAPGVGKQEWVAVQQGMQQQQAENDGGENPLRLAPPQPLAIF